MSMFQNANAKPAEEGLINHVMMIDTETLKTAQSGGGVWKWSTSKGVQDLREGELIVCDRNAAVIGETVKGFTALNGFGRDIVQNAPNDKLRQWVEATYRLRVDGVTQAENSAVTPTQQGFVSRTAGKVRLWASVPMSVGDIAIAHFPLPTDVRHNGEGKPNHTIAAGKIVTELRAYTPLDTANELMAHFELYAADPEKYEPPPKPVYTDAELERAEFAKACRAVANAQLTSGFAFMHAVHSAFAQSPQVRALLQSYFPVIVLGGGDAGAARDRAVEEFRRTGAGGVLYPGEPTNLTVALATALGVGADETKGDTNDVVNRARVARSAQSSEWKKVHGNVYASLFPRNTTGAVAEQALISYKAAGGATKKMAPNTNTVAGTLLDMQMNSTRRLVIGIDELRMKRGQRVIGKVVIGTTTPGAYCHCVM
jgi:hypothetical protein